MTKFQEFPTTEIYKEISDLDKKLFIRLIDNPNDTLSDINLIKATIIKNIMKQTKYRDVVKDYYQLITNSRINLINIFCDYPNVYNRDQLDPLSKHIFNRYARPGSEIHNVLRSTETVEEYKKRTKKTKDCSITRRLVLSLESYYNKKTIPKVDIYIRGQKYPLFTMIVNLVMTTMNDNLFFTLDINHEHPHNLLPRGENIFPKQELLDFIDHFFMTYRVEIEKITLENDIIYDNKYGLTDLEEKRECVECIKQLQSGNLTESCKEMLRDQCYEDIQYKPYDNDYYEKLVSSIP